MRVARVLHQDTERAALISPGGDSVSMFGPGVETIDLITSDHPTRGAIEEVPLDQVRLLAPVDPPTIRDFSTFEQHMERARKSVRPDATVPEVSYASPFCYFSNPRATCSARGRAASAACSRCGGASAVTAIPR